MAEPAESSSSIEVLNFTHESEDSSVYYTANESLDDESPYDEEINCPQSRDINCGINNLNLCESSSVEIINSREEEDLLALNQQRMSENVWRPLPDIQMVVDADNTTSGTYSSTPFEGRRSSTPIIMKTNELNVSHWTLLGLDIISRKLPDLCVVVYY
ncbi:unnamed protein product [Ceratitis capitata]|uniref:(Mediterranean fruit fly) hypothetical protein n=1 Tax=Ceratitis capitata TaxID=7213 RepID=A0A811UAY0_CERCA|nr:unnamed protein product [Ceratitis capitata]